MQSQNGNARGEAGVCVAGRQPEATLQNVQLDYMPLADLVQANVNGQRRASILLAELHSHYADPDTLYLALKSILPDTLQMECLATLRGFARCLQKRLEAEAA